MAQFGTLDRHRNKSKSDIIRVMNASDSTELPDAATAAILLQGAIGQIRFVREYVLGLLDETPRDLWFEIPQGMPSHIAWQVGHLTVSQYGLLMFRLRGRAPDDLELIPSRFRKAFGRGSTPSTDTVKQPSAAELMQRMSDVFDQSLAALSDVSTETLLEPVEMPYAVFPIKLGAILFCPLHENLHAGQIGLLRRALGLQPVR